MSTSAEKRKRSSATKHDQDPSETSTAPDEEQLEDDVDGLPLLSHAEKRRKKREAKRNLNEQDNDQLPKKKRKLKDGTVADDVVDSTVGRQNSVWVGNLSYKTQHENLRAFFKEVGEITRINMPTKVRTGSGKIPENRGFAYVDFATPEAKNAAMGLSEQPLLGRKLLIKGGEDFEGRPATLETVITNPDVAHKMHTKSAQKILSVQKQPAGPTLFFGNLPFQTTDAEIRELLDAHRPRDKVNKIEGEQDEEKPKDEWIKKIRMGTFEDSGLCKGFAFIDFTSVDNATAALINPKNHHLNGRDLVVEYASPEAVRRGGLSNTGGAMPRKRRPLSAGFKKTWGQKNLAPETVAVAADEQNKKEESLSFPRKSVKSPNERPKPGAALALAKRETAAIVPSQGKKVVF